MVSSFQINAAALTKGNALAVAQDVAAVALTTLHTAGRWQVADKREEVGAGGRAGRGALRVVAVCRAGFGCRKRQQDVKSKTTPRPNALVDFSFTYDRRCCFSS